MFASEAEIEFDGIVNVMSSYAFKCALMLRTDLGCFKLILVLNSE